jgi:hypothetical protein
MIAGVILFVVVALFRLLPLMLGFTTSQPDWFVNVSPMAAVILCGAAMLPKRIALVIPFAALLGTDLILNAYYPWIVNGVAQPGGHSLINGEFVAKTLAFVAIAAFGWQMRSHARARTLLPTAIVSSLFYYLVTNTASWLFDPFYVKNFAGWTQALTTGVAGYQPTWTFYQNSFISDIAFTLLFLLCVRPAHQPAAEAKVAAAAW